jgi:hypothetical protein
MKNIVIITRCRYFTALLCLWIFTVCSAFSQKGINKNIGWELPETPQSGIAWPEGQAIPHFTRPASVLDGLAVDGKSLSSSEKLMFSTLQGLVNKTKPRIFLYDTEREGRSKWPDLLSLKVNEYSLADKWKLVKKYQNEISGVILYSVDKSVHYKNLAMTIGGLKNALPVTQSELDNLTSEDVNLPVLVDLTTLSFTSSIEIYQYLYDNYWQDCTKRLLLSLNAREGGYVRDMAVATQAAALWLDPRKEDEAIVLRKFLADMKAGESILLGWWAEERSGIGIGTEYGISTIPSDFYENSTVYAGMPHEIDMPVIPKKPVLENKIYLAMFLSDGDNVQYCQHAMSQLWDNENRGIIPINWTVSPGLVDIGPGLLNYYYKTATSNDFFASGPSGLGYALIYDAHNYKWHTRGRDKFDPYAKFTQKYLERSGLRVITIWDQVDSEQMDSYTENCRYLYGLTQQDWERQKGKIQTVIKEDKMAFIPNLPCYASGVDVIYSFWKDTISAFDGSAPLFLTAQGESWKMGPQNIVDLEKQLEKLSPGNIVICRGDHFFALYNEANYMDFNLTLSDKMEITSSPTTTKAAYAADGTPSGENKWVSVKDGSKWIEFDFKDEYLINRYVIRHAGAGNEDKSLNTKSFKIEVSTNGSRWTTVDNQSGNTANVTDIDIQPVNARYVRLVIEDAGADGIARIADVEIYGRQIKNN